MNRGVHKTARLAVVLKPEAYRALMALSESLMGEGDCRAEIAAYLHDNDRVQFHKDPDTGVVTANYIEPELPAIAGQESKLSKFEDDAVGKPVEFKFTEIDDAEFERHVKPVADVAEVEVKPTSQENKQPRPSFWKTKR